MLPIENTKATPGANRRIRARRGNRPTEPGKLISTTSLAQLRQYNFGGKVWLRSRVWFGFSAAADFGFR
jgi:hypothetical protein